MSGDPFSSFGDTPQDRKQRESLVRKQRWRAFWSALGAVVLIAGAAGLGAAGGGWVIERHPGNVLDRLLGGVVCGLVGGVLALATTLWGITRESVVNHVLGDKDSTDVGATLFWSTVAGTASLGCAGATLGLMGQGRGSQEILVCAAAAVLLALIPAVMARRVARRKSWTGTGSAEYRNTTKG